MSDCSPAAVPTTPFASPVFDARRQAAFCEALSQHGNVRLACQAAGISPQTAYRARRASADLAALWDEALVEARHHVEAVLADRALNGVEEVVYYRGEEVGRRIRYDTRLLLAHLARLDRLADEVAARAAAPFDEGLEALAEGRPVAGQGRALGCPAQGFSANRSEAEAAPPPLEHRLRAMEEARPTDAPPLEALGPWGEVEAVHLAAFEAGESNWWLIAPEELELDSEELEGPEEPSEWERQAARWNPLPEHCSSCSSDP